MNIPVLYEVLDGEANGTVHPFCSDGCLARGLTELVVEPGVVLKAGVNPVSFFDGETICETCGCKIVKDRSKVFFTALAQFAFEAGWDEASGGFRHEGDHQFRSVSEKANEIWQAQFEAGRKAYLIPGTE